MTPELEIILEYLLGYLTYILNLLGVQGDFVCNLAKCWMG